MAGGGVEERWQAVGWKRGGRRLERGGTRWDRSGRRWARGGRRWRRDGRWCWANLEGVSAQVLESEVLSGGDESLLIWRRSTELELATDSLKHHRVVDRQRDEKLEEDVAARPLQRLENGGSPFRLVKPDKLGRGRLAARVRWKR